MFVMGNDIFLTIINKKKSMLLEYANIFFEHTVSNKKKITKTLSSIIDIYIDLFYLKHEKDFSDLDKYFPLQNLKDQLLKETILSTIKFYQDNNISDKIIENKSTIILVSNVLYLAIVLSNKCFSDYDRSADMIVEQFLSKYRAKIRIKDIDKINQLKLVLMSATKKDINSIKKAFKLFNSTNYYIDMKSILGHDSHYLVEFNYDVKMLSKYSKKEIDLALKKNIDLELSIITLEQVIIKISCDYLSGNYSNKYLVKMPIEVFEKQKYSKAIEEMFSLDVIKNNIVFLFEHDMIGDVKTLAKLKNSGFSLGLHKINFLKVKAKSFDNVEYVLAPSNFLEIYENYQDTWKAKAIKFIIS